MKIALEPVPLIYRVSTTVPLVFLIGDQRSGTHFMIAVNAQDLDTKAVTVIIVKLIVLLSMNIVKWLSYLWSCQIGVQCRATAKAFLLCIRTP